jgi:hypothetical protein
MAGERNGTCPWEWPERNDVHLIGVEQMKAQRMNILTACAAVAVLAGCESLGTDPSTGAQLSLSLSGSAAVTPSASTQPSAPSFSVVPVTDAGGRSIDITAVQLVLRDVELKRDREDACHEGGDDDSCERFNAGAKLVTLPLTGGLVTPFTEAIAPGTYDQLRVKIGQPEEENGERAAFYAANPTWPQKATVRVTGTYTSGTGATAQPFDVYLGVNAKVEQELDPPVVVDGTTDPQSLNLTLAVDVSSWFENAAGSLIDPRSISTSPSLLAAVENNVRRSFRALRDDDRNGGDDNRGNGRDGGNNGKGKGNGAEG